MLGESPGGTAAFSNRRPKRVRPQGRGTRHAALREFTSAHLIPAGEVDGSKHRPAISDDFHLPENTEDGHYEVEKILGHCGRTARTLQYLVKWQGYDNGHNSWIRSDACNAPDLVAEYFSSAGMQEHDESDSPSELAPSTTPSSENASPAASEVATDGTKFKAWLADLGFDMRRLLELLKPSRVYPDRTGGIDHRVSMF